MCKIASWMSVVKLHTNQSPHCFSTLVWLDTGLCKFRRESEARLTTEQWTRTPSEQLACSCAIADVSTVLRSNQWGVKHKACNVLVSLMDFDIYLWTTDMPPVVVVVFSVHVAIQLMDGNIAPASQVTHKHCVQFSSHPPNARVFQSVINFLIYGMLISRHNIYLCV
jgi:hypothetical protein